MTTSYKGYEITQCGDGFFIKYNGERVTTVSGSLAYAHYCIDSNYKDMTPQPVDAYEGLDTEQTSGMPTSEEINKACGVKEVCSFEEAVEANTAEMNDFIPAKEKKLTEAQKHAYWDAYHEGYKQAQSELNHIVNP